MYQVTTTCKINVIFVIMLVIKLKILLCSAIDANPTTILNSSMQERVEEYFMEHKVSQKEASASFQKKSKELIHSTFY